MNIVITGASGGLGLALKQRFEADGHTVINLSRSAEGKHAFKFDVSNKAEVQVVMNEVKEKYGKIDILINNAGIALSGVTELLPDEEVRKVIDVNLYGVLNTTQCALPLMQAGGKIVNISSTCAQFALPFRTMYCVTKSAVSMPSDCLRLELENAKIGVTAICPGNIFTNLSKNRVKLSQTNDKYGEAIAKTTDKINKEENNRMTVEYASKKIYSKIKKKKMKPQYIIGRKYKLLFVAQKFLPKSLILWATKKFF